MTVQRIVAQLPSIAYRSTVDRLSPIDPTPISIVPAKGKKSGANHPGSRNQWNHLVAHLIIARSTHAWFPAVRCNMKKVPERLIACECLERAVLDPRFPISKDESTWEYHLRLVPDGYAVINHCWWCGKAVPESKRDDSFHIPSPDEVADAEAVIATIRNRTDMLRVLGEPDFRVIGDPTSKYSRHQFSYFERWQTLHLIIWEFPNGQLDMEIIAKPKNLSLDNGSENG